MVLALHGFSGNHGTFMRTPCVDEAEKNGYILVGVMGYSPSAPFGRTMGARGGRRPGAAPGAVSWCSPGPWCSSRRSSAVRSSWRSSGAVDAARRSVEQRRLTRHKVSALSEKDTMNVLEMVRKEFNVDDNRIYLMGHSMGGMPAQCIWVRNMHRCGQQSLGSPVSARRTRRGR